MIRARTPGRFPPVRRDLAFFVPRATPHASVERCLAGAAGELLTSIELFDIYEGPGTPAGMKSLAYALRFQHAERTLTEAEVSGLQSKMVAAATRDALRRSPPQRAARSGDLTAPRALRMKGVQLGSDSRLVGTIRTTACAPRCEVAWAAS